MSLLETRRLTVAVADTLVCQDLSLALQPAQRWALLGRNGAGKTTLLHALAGLRRPQAGEVLLDGEALVKLPRRAVAQRIGLLLQESHDALPASVLETALLGRHPHLSPWRWEEAQDLEIARKALAAVGLAELEKREVGTLSGGERRRLAIATLLAQDPAVFLLDEPTNHLDLHHQMSILTLLSARVAEQQGGMILCLHDPNLAARFCSHALLLFGDGESLAGPVSEVLTPDILSRLYGHPIRLIEANGDRAFIPGGI